MRWRVRLDLPEDSDDDTLERLGGDVVGKRNGRQDGWSRGEGKEQRYGLQIMPRSGKSG